MGISISHSTGEGVLEQLELVIASDERRDRDPGTRRPSTPIAAQAQTDSSRPRRSTGFDLVDFDSTEREPRPWAAAEDLARLCDLL